MLRVPQHFAVALSAARLIRSKTQREISEGSGVPVWRLRAFEKGLSKPTPAEFASLWNYLSTGDDAPASGGDAA